MVGSLAEGKRAYPSTQFPNEAEIQRDGFHRIECVSDFAGGCRALERECRWHYAGKPTRPQARESRAHVLDFKPRDQGLKHGLCLRREPAIEKILDGQRGRIGKDRGEIGAREAACFAHRNRRQLEQVGQARRSRAARRDRSRRARRQNQSPSRPPHRASRRPPSGVRAIGADEPPERGLDALGYGKTHLSFVESDLERAIGHHAVVAHDRKHGATRRCMAGDRGDDRHCPSARARRRGRRNRSRTRGNRRARAASARARRDLRRTCRGRPLTTMPRAPLCGAASDRFAQRAHERGVERVDGRVREAELMDGIVFDKIEHGGSMIRFSNRRQVDRQVSINYGLRPTIRPSAPTRISPRNPTSPSRSPARQLRTEQIWRLLARLLARRQHRPRAPAIRVLAHADRARGLAGIRERNAESFVHFPRGLVDAEGRAFAAGREIERGAERDRHRRGPSACR